MTNNEENDYAMYRNVIGVLDMHKETTNTLIAFEESYTDFKQCVDGIRKNDLILKTSASGKTDTKLSAEEQLEKELIPFSKNLYVFARRNNLLELMILSDLKEYKNKRFREQELIIRAKAVIKKAKEHIAVLGKYGITEEKINSLELRIQQFEESISYKGEGFSPKSTARQILNSLFDKANDLLKNELDQMIESFLIDNVDLYNQYFSARVVKDLGIKHENVEETKTEEIHSWE